MRFRLSLCTQLYLLGFHVWLFEWYEVAGMDNALSSSAIYRFDGDPLAISLHHSSNSGRSVHLRVHLGEALMTFEDKLAGLEMEQERGPFPAVLVAAGERAYVLFALSHPHSSQLLQPQHLSK